VLQYGATLEGWACARRVSRKFRKQSDRKDVVGVALLHLVPSVVQTLSPAPEVLRNDELPEALFTAAAESSSCRDGVEPAAALLTSLLRACGQCFASMRARYASRHTAQRRRSMERFARVWSPSPRLVAAVTFESSRTASTLPPAAVAGTLLVASPRGVVEFALAEAVWQSDTKRYALSSTCPTPGRAFSHATPNRSSSRTQGSPTLRFVVAGAALEAAAAAVEGSSDEKFLTKKTCALCGHGVPTFDPIFKTTRAAITHTLMSDASAASRARVEVVEARRNEERRAAAPFYCFGCLKIHAQLVELQIRRRRSPRIPAAPTVVTTRVFGAA